MGTRPEITGVDRLVLRRELADRLLDGGTTPHEAAATAEALWTSLGLPGEPPSASVLAAAVVLQRVAEALVARARERSPRLLLTVLVDAEARIGVVQATDGLARFSQGWRADSFPLHTADRTAALLVLGAALDNPALGALHPLQRGIDLGGNPGALLAALEAALTEGPGPGDTPLPLQLRAPALAAPTDLFAQLAWVAEHQADLLPPDVLDSLLRAQDLQAEAEAVRGGPPGAAPVLSFVGEDAEAFSEDRDWMPRLVLMARQTFVWLDQLSASYQRPITTLDQIPDAELDALAEAGFTGLWLIGLWERAPASRAIKRRRGNPEAEASAYAVGDYVIAADLGGEAACGDLRERAAARGIRLAADMVPNHMGLDSRWVAEHPDWFVQLPHAPFPGYSFSGPDLSSDPRIRVFLEDGYWNESDAAVVFKHVDVASGQERFVYHGNDGTQMPWNDTAQLDYLQAGVREAVIQQILAVAARFPVIRFDAAMTLAKKHVQRLWYPAPGHGGAIPSRAENSVDQATFDRLLPREFWREVVERIAAERPDTLLLAEAFWMMEGYFVRTLGMHRVYNSAFMHMLRDEDNAKYRQSIKNVLEYSPAILERFVNFMNNPDEETAAEQFGTGEKYFGICTLLATLPGLPMFGHGQLQGFTEKYGMEYRKAYRDESVNEGLLDWHRQVIFPLLRDRHLFAGVEHFALYDFVLAGGEVDENVFAYSNRGPDGGRALVVYNNAWEGTAGRLRSSSAINVGDVKHPSFEQRSLAQALDLDPELFYGLHELRTGGWFLRSGRELLDEGLFAELDGYGCLVFVEFEELDDADGRWSALAAELDGRSVPDLTGASAPRASGPATGRRPPPRA